ncbi:Elongation factor Ts isoform 1 [Schistosoma japonicum]|uniref:Elongation factor Ts, mitochondrial n=2 Tax=Schistosoma japonicum TaxID=6182 RepID=C1LDZ6_SCHJA|nr:Elongation factor Ts, mitochondrial [Schistosoma japonicum]TNN05431.1 Elongation factor Ts isoform 1 [Schistosoma japonicum]CAX72924.1 Ts translation elongation factor, mitochondrial [Schistosoma japonicum]
MNVFVFPTLVNKTSKFCGHIRMHSKAADKALLYKLRKLTGYTFSACKEALIRHDNDLDKAKEWLTSEAVSRGWDKAGKLAGRIMNEGLLGVLGTRSRAVIVEVNCETDFVSRNHSFQSLVAVAAETVMNNYTEPTKISLDSSHLDKLVTSNSSTLKDTLVAAIGSIGESIQLRRAVGLCVPDIASPSRLAIYSHVSTEGILQGIRDVRFGKYAAIIRYRPLNDKPANDAWHERAARLGRQICQHIVGMNPNPGLESVENPTGDPDEEKFLLLQPFLLDETICVGEHLLRNEIVLEDFVRVECGEDNQVDNSKNVSKENPFTTQSS